MSARFSTLREWLQWQESLHPSVIELGLDRIRSVAVALFGADFLARQPLTITVGGTNGKGSCVTALAALLHATGRRVGSFTSPHLVRYNERIRIDTQEVSDAELCDAFAAIDAARGDTSLTYFEFNALAALWLFRQHAVEVQVLEVGLGGRLDAANLLDADIAVITNVAIDHVEWLGSTREAIGWEKAGILRPGGKLVYGEADMPASVQRAIDALEVHCRRAGRDFSLHADAHQLEWRGLSQHEAVASLRCPRPDLPLPSVACALQVLAWLGIWEESVFARVLPGITLPGRWQRVSARDREWLLDVAHNEAGAHFLAERLRHSGEAPVTAVFSAMADKDLVAIFSALAPVVRHWLLFPLADNPRAATLAQLAAAAAQAGIPGTALQPCQSVEEALAAAAPQRGTVLVCGSFFTVAAVQSVLDPH